MNLNKKEVPWFHGLELGIGEQVQYDLDKSHPDSLK